MRDAFLEDLRVGQCFGSGILLVSAEDIIRFAQEFDPRPFHLDPAQAGETLFGGLAASGWHTAALTMHLLVEESSCLQEGSSARAWTNWPGPFPCARVTHCKWLPKFWRSADPKAARCKA